MVFPVLNILGGIGMAILVYVGGLSAAAGAITAGAWYLFLQSLDQFFFPVLTCLRSAQLQTGLSAAERIFGLIDATPKVVQASNLHLPLLQGEICFDHLTFRYQPDAEPVLDDFSLEICPGENIALVGHRSQEVFGHD
jgi:ATP-binding cassette subfamily B protein